MCMATEIFQVSIVGAGKRGALQERSAVAAAAYLSGEKFLKYDYSNKAGEVVYTNIFAPPDVPEWVSDWKVLWQNVEQVEYRRDAQLARSMYFSLPKELSREQHIALLADYAQTFVEEGMIAMVSMHDDGTGNPHAHLLLPMRLLHKDGTWAAKATLVYVVDENGERIKQANGGYKTTRKNTTTWDNCSNVEKWRKRWANIVNTHLKMAGFETRIDVRSYQERGIQKIPTLRLSCAEYELEQQGIPTAGGELNRLIRMENQMRAEIEQFTQKMLRKRRWKRQASPQRQELEKFWHEQRASESHDSVIQEGAVLSETWRVFKHELHHSFLDTPVHHRRSGRSRSPYIGREP